MKPRSKLTVQTGDLKACWPGWDGFSLSLELLASGASGDLSVLARKKPHLLEACPGMVEIQRQLERILLRREPDVQF